MSLVVVGIIILTRLNRLILRYLLRFLKSFKVGINNYIGVLLGACLPLFLAKCLILSTLITVCACNRQERSSFFTLFLLLFLRLVVSLGYGCKLFFSSCFLSFFLVRKLLILGDSLIVGTLCALCVVYLCECLTLLSLEQLLLLCLIVSLGRNLTLNLYRSLVFLLCLTSFPLVLYSLTVSGIYCGKSLALVLLIGLRLFSLVVSLGGYFLLGLFRLILCGCLVSLGITVYNLGLLVDSLVELLLRLLVLYSLTVSGIYCGKSLALILLIGLRLLSLVVSLGGYFLLGLFRLILVSLGYGCKLFFGSCFLSFFLVRKLLILGASLIVGTLCALCVVYLCECLTLLSLEQLLLLCLVVSLGGYFLLGLFRLILCGCLVSLGITVYNLGLLVDSLVELLFRLLVLYSLTVSCIYCGKSFSLVLLTGLRLLSLVVSLGGYFLLNLRGLLRLFLCRFLIRLHVIIYALGCLGLFFIFTKDPLRIFHTVNKRKSLIFRALSRLLLKSLIVSLCRGLGLNLLRCLCLLGCYVCLYVVVYALGCLGLFFILTENLLCIFLAVNNGKSLVFSALFRLLLKSLIVSLCRGLGLSLLRCLCLRLLISLNIFVCNLVSIDTTGFCRLASRLILKSLCSVNSIDNGKSLALLLLVKLILLTIVVLVCRYLLRGSRCRGLLCLFDSLLCLFGLFSLNYRSYDYGCAILLVLAAISLCRLKLLTLVGLLLSSESAQLAALLLICLVCGEKRCCLGNTGINPLAVLGLLILILDYLYILCIIRGLICSVGRLILGFFLLGCLELLLGYVVFGLLGLGSIYHTVLSVLASLELSLVVFKKSRSLRNAGINPLLACGSLCCLALCRGSLCCLALCCGSLCCLTLCRGSLCCFGLGLILTVGLLLSLGESLLLVLKVGLEQLFLLFLASYPSVFLLKARSSSLCSVYGEHLLLLGYCQKLVGRERFGIAGVGNSAGNVCGRKNSGGCRRSFLALVLLYADNGDCGVGLGLAGLFICFLFLFGFLFLALAIHSSGSLIESLLCLCRLLRLLVVGGRYVNGSLCYRSGSCLLNRCGCCCGGYGCRSGRGCDYGYGIGIYFALGNDRWRRSSGKTCLMSHDKLCSALSARGSFRSFFLEISGINVKHRHSKGGRIVIINVLIIVIFKGIYLVCKYGELPLFLCR